MLAAQNSLSQEPAIRRLGSQQAQRMWFSITTQASARSPGAVHWLELTILAPLLAVVVVLVTFSSPTLVIPTPSHTVPWLQADVLAVHTHAQPPSFIDTQYDSLVLS